ncbi:hypothetical protein AYP82_08225 [Lactobacillus crispatus]|uniref:O-antigen ligase-related domain-containing protein n=2 Tax=Lactobacillus crispatus TaxID=47770 RepID=A0A854PMS3_9LACO|nr:hypothetical protein AYP82_08225 [Lactobacillus crispatus]
MHHQNRIVSITNIVLLFSFYTYLYILHLPAKLSNPSYMGIPIIISFLSIIILYVSKNFEYKLFQFNKYIIFYLIVLLIEFLVTCYKYPNIPFVSTFQYMYSYLIVISYFILSCYAQEDFSQFLKTLIYFADFAIIIILAQAILFNKDGFFFLNRNYFSDTNSFIDTRNFGIRLIGSYLIDFTVIISIGCLFSKKRWLSSKTLIINIILTCAYQILSSQTRSTQLLCGLILMISFLFLDYKNKAIKLFINIIIISIIVYICLQFLGEITNSIASKHDWSYYHRIDEISFLWSAFKEHPLLGNGFVDENMLLNVVGINNLNGYYFGLYYSDVGVIGLLAQGGILGLSLYILPLMFILKRMSSSKQNIVLLTSMFVGIVGSMLNLSLFDNPRLMIIPLYLAVLDGIKSNKEV